MQGYWIESSCNLLKENSPALILRNNQERDGDNPPKPLAERAGPGVHSQ